VLALSAASPLSLEQGCIFPRGSTLGFIPGLGGKVLIRTQNFVILLQLLTSEMSIKR
jgi:hypothetical protein